MPLGDPGERCLSVMLDFIFLKYISLAELQGGCYPNFI